MRTLTLGLGALVCTVAILASTVNSATAEPRGHRDWNKAEQSGWRDGHRAYGYRPYDGPWSPTYPIQRDRLEGFGPAGGESIDPIRRGLERRQAVVLVAQPVD